MELTAELENEIESRIKQSMIVIKQIVDKGCDKSLTADLGVLMYHIEMINWSITKARELEQAQISKDLEKEGPHKTNE